MIELWNPKWYWHTKFTEEQQQQADELINPLLDDESMWQSPVDWSRFCSVKSSIPFRDGEMMMKKFMGILEPSFTQFIAEMQWRTDVQIRPDGVWLNKYGLNDHQEFHNHATRTCNISMVYFHRTQTQSFHFFDPDWIGNRASGLDTIMDLPSFEIHTPKVEQGYIMLFPSQYGHYVTPNPTNDLRVTVSGNFEFEPRPVTMNELAQMSGQAQQSVQ